VALRGEAKRFILPYLGDPVKVGQGRGGLTMSSEMFGTRSWVLNKAVVAGLLLFVAPVRAQTPSPSALAGQVTSQEEGAMEGVLVSAKRAGSTITITVVSNAEGQYNFPRDRLAPGKYSVAIRAVGYELPSPTS